VERNCSQYFYLNFCLRKFSITWCGTLFYNTLSWIQQNKGQCWCPADTKTKIFIMVYIGWLNRNSYIFSVCALFFWLELCILGSMAHYMLSSVFQDIYCIFFSVCDKFLRPSFFPCVTALSVLGSLLEQLTLAQWIPTLPSLQTFVCLGPVEISSSEKRHYCLCEGFHQLLIRWWRWLLGTLNWWLSGCKKSIQITVLAC
jgi:hypothetical protein